jgi:predicted PurR-regulated permease PerM
MVSERTVRHIIPSVMLAGLLLLSWAVLSPFIIPASWAAIIAFATWPLYERLRRTLRHHHTLAALVMTVLLATAVVLPLLWLMGLLQREVGHAYAAVQAQLAQGVQPFLERIGQLPWIGERLREYLETTPWNPEAIRDELLAWMRDRVNWLLNIVGGVGRNAVKLALALVTVFFIYRDGERLLYQVHSVLHRFLGPRIDGYLTAMAGMTKAVVWGLVVTAIAQGIVAALGYWWVGLSAPVLAGMLTALIAMIPFGTPFAWGSIAVWLLLEGDTVGGITLLLWGTLVVSWVDNLVRPIVISSATRIPFLLVMFGVLGGLAAFGLIGLFVGPVILAVLVAVWREWIAEAELAAPDADAAAPASEEVPAAQQPEQS